MTPPWAEQSTGKRTRREPWCGLSLRCLLPWDALAQHLHANATTKHVLHFYAAASERSRRRLWISYMAKNTAALVLCLCEGEGSSTEEAVLDSFFFPLKQSEEDSMKALLGRGPPWGHHSLQSLFCCKHFVSVNQKNMDKLFFLQFYPTLKSFKFQNQMQKKRRTKY